MQTTTPRILAFNGSRSLLRKVGHEVVWLGIAALFCVVEAGVLLTEIRPSRIMTGRKR